MKPLVGFYNKSVIATYCGVAFAVAGMFFAVSDKIKLALFCMILCGVCDMFDGKIARRCKRTQEEKEFGLQLDSLADMVDFAVFPVVLGASLGCVKWYNVVISIIYITAAIIRLGFFNVMTVHEESGIYHGLPVTVASVIFPVVCFAGMLFSGEIPKILFTLTMLLTSVFFVLNFKFKKPKGYKFIFGALLAFLIITVAIYLI